MRRSRRKHDIFFKIVFENFLQRNTFSFFFCLFFILPTKNKQTKTFTAHKRAVPFWFKKEVRHFVCSPIESAHILQYLLHRESRKRVRGTKTPKKTMMFSPDHLISQAKNVRTQQKHNGEKCLSGGEVSHTQKFFY